MADSGVVNRFLPAQRAIKLSHPPFANILLIGATNRADSLDPALLATRADIVAFLRGDDDARLGSGWRNELVGEGIRRLVGGEAGLTFDPEGRLRLHSVTD